MDLSANEEVRVNYCWLIDILLLHLLGCEESGNNQIDALIRKQISTSSLWSFMFFIFNLFALNLADSQARQKKKKKKIQ